MLAAGGEWIEPAERLRMEQEEAERMAEEARIEELKAYCKKKGLDFTSKPLFSLWSGRHDSNMRPSVPKTDALPNCATPRRAQFLHSRALHCQQLSGLAGQGWGLAV